MNVLKLLDRKKEIFLEDIIENERELSDLVKGNRFLVIGGAGSIGQAVAKEIFKRDPLVLHIIDINENNLVELVRDIRSSLGYIKGDFKTFALDCSGKIFDSFVNENFQYDYVLNLSALKHVRSEKDPYTLMRLVEVNILNTIKTLKIAAEKNCKKYFCVSTDKAANPVNMMGASKRIMEMFLIHKNEVPVSTSRFANVAFSDGSLLHSFSQRFSKLQPIVAPINIERYFLTTKEAGKLCLISCLLGKDKDIMFPNLSEELHLTKFPKIATNFLNQKGFKPYYCNDEEEARNLSEELIKKKLWPCYFFESDTTGEKSFEEFYTEKEDVDFSKFKEIGIAQNNYLGSKQGLEDFLFNVKKIRKKDFYKKEDILNLFKILLPDFNHKETGRYLDDRM